MKSYELQKYKILFYSVLLSDFVFKSVTLTGRFL